MNDEIIEEYELSNIVYVSLIMALYISVYLIFMEM